MGSGGMIDRMRAAETAAMNLDLVKKDWIRALWRETEKDERAREFFFGFVIEDLEVDIEAQVDAGRGQIRDELRGEIKQELIEDPPDDLRANVIRDLIEYPGDIPSRVAREWEKLTKSLQDEVRIELENKMGDLELENDQLRKEIATLKENKR